MVSLKPIPFDSVCVAAMTRALQGAIGAKVQKVVQPDSDQLVLGLYFDGEEKSLLLNASAEFSRFHFTQRKLKNASPMLSLCTALRATLLGTRLRSVKQNGFDRVVEFVFESLEGEYSLIWEKIGKQSNLIFCDGHRRILSVAKRVKSSKRAILPNQRYEFPDASTFQQIFGSESLEELKAKPGCSPLFVQYLTEKLTKTEALSSVLNELRRSLESGKIEPFCAGARGVYPFDLTQLGYEGAIVSDLSEALDLSFAQREESHQFELTSRHLKTQLERVFLAKELAVRSLEEVQDTATRAAELQMQAELILAYGYSLESGATLLETVDYSGNPLTIKLNPDLDFKQNANKIFEKAKRAKSRMNQSQDQLVSLRKELELVVGCLQQLAEARDLHEIAAVHEVAIKMRWLHLQVGGSGQKAEDRPFEGKRIREKTGPGGFNILYGENAEANDYLTMRLGKPNDIWLHVRGATSAHVLIQTHNQPQKVAPEVLIFAAKIAVQNSVSKHSQYVPVDWTLKKYVRKPRGSAVGAVTYTHEKTIHVEMDREESS